MGASATRKVIRNVPRAVSTRAVSAAAVVGAGAEAGAAAGAEEGASVGGVVVVGAMVAAVVVVSRGVSPVGGAAVVACGPAINATMHASASATVANTWRWFRMERVGFIIGDSPIVRTTTTRGRCIHVSGLIARRIAGVQLGDAFIDPPQSPLRGARFRVTRHDALREDRTRSWITG